MQVYNEAWATSTQDLYLTASSSTLPANSTINLVAVGDRSAKINSGPSPFSLEIEQKSGGTIASTTALVLTSASWVTNDASAEPHNYRLTAYTDPTGATWTNSTIGTMQIGMQIATSTAVTNYTGVSTLWAYVEYAPGPPTITSVSSVTSTAARTYNASDTDGLIMLVGNNFGSAGTSTILGVAATQYNSTGGPCSVAGYTSTTVCSGGAPWYRFQHLQRHYSVDPNFGW